MSLLLIHPALLTLRLSRMQRCLMRTSPQPPVLSLATLSVWRRWLPAVVATALSSSQSDSSRRRRKRRRRTVSPAVPCGLADMDTSVGEVPGHSLFKTFRGVWEDKLSWEEFPSRKPCYRVNTPPEPSPSPAVSPPLSFSASSATPVPPASPVPSSFL